MTDKYKSIGVLKKVKRNGCVRYLYIHTYVCKSCGKPFSCTNSQKIILHRRLCVGCSHYKPVAFRFYDTNATEYAPSTVVFCAKHPELGKNAYYHFASVINGKRLHHKGWLLASNGIKIDKAKVRVVTQTILNTAVSS